MNYNYNKLLQPIKINGMRLRNRIMMSGMGTFTPMVDGTDSEEGIRYYEEMANCHSTEVKKDNLPDFYQELDRRLKEKEEA